MPLAMACSPPLDAQAQPIRRYALEDRVRIESSAGGRGPVDVWCPLIPDTPYQRVVLMDLEAPGPWTVGHDGEHGNRMLHARVDGRLPEPVFRLQYVVERRPLPHMLDPACVGPLGTPALFQPWLRAEGHVTVDEGTRGLARQVVGAATNPLAQARRIYEHVAGAMTYNAAAQSWTGSTEHALACATGNCNDIHALFISLCRSVGIPARLVLGQAFEPPPPGQEACDLCGYHCWAEFFAAGLGWLPADASCACKYGRHLFGDLELNHVAWSVGRDILLAPPQRGSRVLFFSGPYVEVDGEPARAVDRHIRFSEA